MLPFGLTIYSYISHLILGLELNYDESTYIYVCVRYVSSMKRLAKLSHSHYCTKQLFINFSFTQPEMPAYK